MSIQGALDFIREFREEPRTNLEMRVLVLDRGLGSLVKEANRRGHDFSIQELRKAHVLDYRMRAQHFSNPKISN